MRFRVWLTSEAEGEAYVYAIGALQAAESYARHLYDKGDLGDLQSDCVIVRDEAGKLTEFVVSVNLAPSFRARLKTGGAR
jgi:hypothetical protein